LNIRKFDDDLQTMCDRASLGKAPIVREKLEVVRSHLVDLYRKNLVKINHSVIELLCAGSLVESGYEVQVEMKVGDDLICDVYGAKGEGSIIVEIETGFVPPSNALDPARYCYARILSKTARYSAYANRFVLGTTISNILPIPAIFQEPPRFRKHEDVDSEKKICDVYYKNPPISSEQIRNAELHSIFIIDVDSGSLKETTADVYLNNVKNLSFHGP
jgi:hypothetical protein